MAHGVICGSGHVSGDDPRSESVRWKCIACNSELELGVVETPSRCHVCGSRGWLTAPPGPAQAVPVPRART